ncbi:hypothetical protein ACFLYO_07820 [Chloroflexota bacterium]
MISSLISLGLFRANGLDQHGVKRHTAMFEMSPAFIFYPAGHNQRIRAEFQGQCSDFARQLFPVLGAYLIQTIQQEVQSKIAFLQKMPCFRYIR